eukprot:463376-Pyramimonas_sp.AAC.1
MADASESGYGSSACDGDPEEARAEAARGTEGLRGPQVEETYTEREREVEAVGGEEDLLPRPRVGRPGALELFSGASGLLGAIRRSRPFGERRGTSRMGVGYDGRVSEGLGLLLKRAKLEEGNLLCLAA